MKFLIDEDLPRSVGPLLKKFGHEARDVRDIGLRGAKDSAIAAYAQQYELCILTGDYDFSDVRNYPPQNYAGIVVLNVPRDAGAMHIINLLEEFLLQEKIINELSGALIIVEPGRIRLRRH